MRCVMEDVACMQLKTPLAKAVNSEESRLVAAVSATPALYAIFPMRNLKVHTLLAR